MKKVNNIRYHIVNMNNPIRLKGLVSRYSPKMEKCLAISERILNERNTSLDNRLFHECVESFFLLGNRFFGKRTGEDSFTRIPVESSNKEDIARILFNLAKQAKYTNIIGVNLIIPVYATSCGHVSSQPGFIIDIEKDLC